MAVGQSPCWVCSSSSAAFIFPLPTVLPYLGTRRGFKLSSLLKM